MRALSFVKAINEAQAQCMERNPNVYVIGLGVPGPTGIFGSTVGLLDRFGPARIRDMPASEGGMTGVALGSTLVGMRPIMVHIRMDFAVLSMEALVNQAAKWHFMYGGKMRAPLTVRMIVGRGWGQGPQHSQSLQAWFAHVPGLKVVMPTTPHDAKGMLIAAVEDDAPVIFIEHRWLYDISGPVPEDYYRVPLDSARIARPGRDVTLAATSFMTIECLRAAEQLAAIGIEAEVLDLRCLTPIDRAAIRSSVERTGRLIAVDTGHSEFGVGAEVLAVAVESAHASLKAAPKRIGLPFTPTPTTPSLAEVYYPRSGDIARAAAAMLGSISALPEEQAAPGKWHDIPDRGYTGPY